MKKILVLAIALVMMLTLVACGNGGGQEAQPTQIGTSAFSIVIPEGYAETEDDFSEDQIAYYFKDDASIDFDLFQWPIDISESTLEAEAEYWATEYGTVAEPVTVNGIDGMKYVSEEEYEGETYFVINYLFEDAENFVEICFWVNGTEKEYADVDAIINTLEMN